MAKKSESGKNDNSNMYERMKEAYYEAINDERLKSLLKEAKGEDRSFSKYAEDAGVSPAAITRIMKGDYRPSPLTLKKLTSDAAAPRGGVIFEDLMMAAGYIGVTRFGVEGGQEFYERFNGEKIVVKNSLADIETGIDSAAERLERNEYINEELEYSKECTSQIYTAFAEKGILFRKCDNVRFGYDGAATDLSVEIMEAPVKKWVFDFDYIRSTVKPFHGRTFLPLTEALMLRPDSDMKYSIVVNKEKVFQRYKRYEHALPYRGELSVIYYDRDNKRIADECYLSNYNEGDTSREIYLTEH